MNKLPLKPFALIALGTLAGCEMQNALADDIREAVYCEADGEPLKLDIYPAEAEGPGRGTVLYFHGGGYTEGDKREGFELRRARLLTKFGFTVASVNYRLAPRHIFPAQLEDAACAINYATEKLDPRWIGVMGDSAGGHLASLIGVLGDTGSVPKVSAVAAFYGAFDLQNMEADSLLPQAMQSAFPSEALRKQGSPISEVSPADPPFLLVHGKQDRFISIAQSVRFAVRLKENSHDPLMAVVKNADHGLFPINGRPAPDPDTATIDKLFVAFFVGHSK